MSFENDITPSATRENSGGGGDNSGGVKTFAGKITRDWFIIVGPNGGFIAAALLRALNLALGDPQRAARVLSVDFFSPPKEGAYLIKTRVIRHGKNLTSMHAEMWQGEVLAASANASFAKSYQTRIALAHEKAPHAKPFDECQVMPPLLPIHKQYEMRPAFDVLPFTKADKALSGGWTRFKEPPPKFNAEMLAAISDCWPPALFSIMSQENFGQSRGMPTIELSIYFIQPDIYPQLKTSDPVLARFQALETTEGFFTEDGDIWSADGRLLARVRQLAIAL